jgi:hypothetical protein
MSVASPPTMRRGSLQSFSAQAGRVSPAKQSIDKSHSNLKQRSRMTYLRPNDLWIFVSNKHDNSMGTHRLEVIEGLSSSAIIGTNCLGGVVACA